MGDDSPSFTTGRDPEMKAAQSSRDLVSHSLQLESVLQSHEIPFGQEDDLNKSESRSE